MEKKKLVDIFSVTMSCLPQLTSEAEVKEYLLHSNLYDIKWDAENGRMISIDEVVDLCRKIPDITDAHREFVIRQVYPTFGNMVLGQEPAEKGDNKIESFAREASSYVVSREASATPNIIPLNFFESAYPDEKKLLQEYLRYLVNDQKIRTINFLQSKIEDRSYKRIKLALQTKVDNLLLEF